MDFYFGTEDMMMALEQSDEVTLAKLDELREPVLTAERVNYLSRAIAMRGPKVLEAMLDKFPTEEYAGFVQIPKFKAEGAGSLLLLCAMLDRPKHAKILLDRGYDPNGAGLELADFLDEQGKYWTGATPKYGKNVACFANFVSIDCDDNSTLGISCATPLAAAIFMGSLETAKLLLEHPGTWKTESSSVCRSVAMALEGITDRYIGGERCKMQAEILRLMLYPQMKTLPPKEQILRENYLHPVSFVDICSANTLALQLESGLCTETDGRMLLDKLDGRKRYEHRLSERGMSTKLLLIKKYYPMLCRGSRAKGIFLEKLFRQYMLGEPYQGLLKAWKQLSGTDRDLTWIAGNLWNPNIKLKPFLDMLGEGGKLTMDADAFGRWYGGKSSAMNELLKRVDFRRSDDGKLSGVMRRLLGTEDLRLMEQAAKNGVFTREDPKMLMDYMVQTGNMSSGARSLVLIHAKNQRPENEPEQDWRDADRWMNWTEHWGISEEENNEQLRIVQSPDRSRDEYLKAMSQIRKFMNQEVFPQDMPVGKQEYPDMKTDSLLGIACCSESTEPLAILLEKMPHMLYDTIRASWNDKFFRGSALSFCAAMGKTEHIKLLLEKGCDPNEIGSGHECRFFARRKDFSDESIMLTPLLTAVLFGEEEAARVLMEQGASCDLSKKAQLKVLFMGSAESFALAKKLSLPGVESISIDDLAGIRISTAPNGSRTKFWEEIKTGSCVQA